MFNKKNRYLLAAALLVLVLFCVYFAYALSTAMVQEKFTDRKLEADLICDEIDDFLILDNDWGSYDYQSVLSKMVSQIDATVTSYAELFDEGLASVSVRTPLFNERPFDPKDYPGFLEAIGHNERGDIAISVGGGGGAPAYTQYMYFRWVPTDKTLSNRMLVVVGVSKYSLNNGIPPLIEYGAVALIIVSSIFIIGATILFCKLRDKYAGG